MSTNSLRSLALALPIVLGMGASLGAEPSGYRISGPLVHKNLAIYFVHAQSADGPIPLTLEEALARGRVKVHETGSVNRLEVENLGDDEVFIQSGDIVKGGRQDRVLSASLLLSANSGRVSIAAFCVEHDRWSARGNEDSRSFLTSHAMLPSREARLVIAAAPITTSNGPAPYPTSTRQVEVWKDVANVQANLSRNLGAPVASPRSRSSLQLSLENEELSRAVFKYVTALTPAGEAPADVVGLVVAINGRLSGADIYSSAGLYRKMWPKLLRAAATEALAVATQEMEPTPSIEAVTAFLSAGEGARTSEHVVSDHVAVEVRETAAVLYTKTEAPAKARAALRTLAAGAVHQSYLAK